MKEPFKLPPMEPRTYYLSLVQASHCGEVVVGILAESGPRVPFKAIFKGFKFTPIESALSEPVPFGGNWHPAIFKTPEGGDPWRLSDPHYFAAGDAYLLEIPPQGGND